MLRDAPNTAEPVEVSVIVPCAGELLEIGELVDALEAQDAGFAWETVFVDNHITAAARERLEQAVARLPRARIVSEHDRAGIGPARNAGVRGATGDVVAFVDADDVPEVTWLSSLASDVPVNSISAGRLDVTKLNPPWLAKTRSRGDDGDGPYLCEGVYPVAPGGNMAIRRDDFERLSGFDECNLALEDFEFCLRAWESGLTVRSAGPASVVHYRLRDTARTLARQGFLYGEARARTFAQLRARRLVPRHSFSGWKSWLLLALLAPLAPFSRRMRCTAAWVLGNRVGRLAGSWKHGVLYL
jgi:GT2 family glycosyltransferase